MDLGFRSDPNLHRAHGGPLRVADRSAARGWVASARLLASGSSGSTYWLVIVMERKVVAERAHTLPAASLPSAPRQRELPAAARKSELPLSRFPLRGKAGAGVFPPRRWHAARQQKALAPIDAAAPPARGFQSAPLKPPLRIPPTGTPRGPFRWSASIPDDLRPRVYEII
jgi:hypothetical protein